MRVAERLASNDVEGVRRAFNDTMMGRPEVTPKAMRDVWKMVLRSNGAFVGIGIPVVFTTVEVPLTFERGSAILRVTYDSDDKIAGLFITPA